MSIEIHSVGAIRFLSEGTFAVDGTGTLGNYTYLPFNEGTAQITLTTAEHDPLNSVASRVEAREWVLGKKSATLTFTMNLSPTGTAAASGVTAISGPLGKLLKAVMGGENLGVGTTFTGGTAEVPTVTSAAGLAVGAAIGWANAAGTVEWREIESISGTSITLKQAFSGAPANATICYACASYHFTEDPSETLQFLVEGVESDDRWLLLGGQAVGGVTFDLAVSGDGIPTATFNFTFANYKRSNETTGTVTGALASPTYAGYSPIVGHVGELRAFVVGTATLSDASIVHCSALAWNPKIAFGPVPSPKGTNGVHRWRALRASPPIEGSFDTFYEDLTWWTARDDKARRHLQYTCGTAAGAAIVFSAPCVQITNPQRSAGGELAGQTVSYRGRRDIDVGASTTALAKSPARIHIG